MKRQDYKADYAKALKFAARKGLSVADQLQFAADFANTGSLWTTLNEAYAQFKIDYAEISTRKTLLVSPKLVLTNYV